MDWIEILKNKQILTPTTKISQRKEPVEEDDDNKCCEEAAEKFEVMRAKTWGLSPPSPSQWLSWCKTGLLTELLKSILTQFPEGRVGSIERDKQWNLIERECLKIAEEWKECEEW
jgi:hypothetical protein